MQATEPRQIWSVDYAFGFVSKEDTGDIPEDADDEKEAASTSKNKAKAMKKSTKPPLEQQPYRGVLIFLDNATLFTLVLPVKGKTSDEFLQLFKAHIINAYSVPMALRTDGETCIKSAKVQKYLEDLSITHLPTAGSSAFSNGKIENHISKLKTLLATTYHQEGKEQWTETLPLVANAHNKCPLMLTKTADSILTPELLFFGNKLADKFLPVHIDQDKGYSAEDYVKYLQDTVQHNRQLAADRMDQGQKRRLRSENKNKKAKTFAVADVVWLKNTEIAKRRTLKQRFGGPHVITAIRHNTATVKNSLTGEVRKVHFRHIEHVEDVPDTLTKPENILKLAKTIMQ
jgi:hypothetical protein